MAKPDGKPDYRERQRMYKRLRAVYTHCPICGRELLWDVKTYVDPRDGRRKPHPRSVEWDHKHPRSKGGDNSFENAQPLCRECNRAKSDKLNYTGDAPGGRQEPPQRLTEPISWSDGWL